MRRLGIGLMLLVLGIGIVSAQDNDYRGFLDRSTPEASYTFSLEVGDAVFITAEATSGNLDTTLVLRDPAGNIIARYDDRGQGIYNSSVGYTATVSGTYTVIVSRYAYHDTSGDFRLSMVFGEEASRARDAVAGANGVRLSGPELTQETEHFLIHYTREGRDAATDEYAGTVARAAEQVWDIEIEQMGWPIPPTDGMAGGDSRYDVYLLDLTDEWSGFALSGYTAPRHDFGDNPNTPVLEDKATSSYMALENDFEERSDIETRVGDLVYATAAHEFHHFIQDGLDYRDSHTWYYEASASWMQMAITPKDDRTAAQVAYNFDYPELCFGTRQDPNFGQLAYGEWVFLQSLVDAHGPDIMTKLWANIAQYEGFDALEATLAKYDDTIPAAMARHRIQNLLRAYEQAPYMGDATVWMEQRITSPGQWDRIGDGVQELVQG